MLSYNGKTIKGGQKKMAKQSNKPKMDKSKLMGRILAAFLAILMLVGVATSLIYAIQYNMR